MKTQKKLGIKIELENVDEITAFIDQVEGRSSVCCVSAEFVIKCARKAEEELAGLGLPVHQRAGARYEYHAGGASAKSYRYARGATAIRIQRRSTCWYLTAVYRVYMFPQEPGIARLTITCSQRDEVVRRFSNSLSFYDPEQEAASAARFAAQQQVERALMIQPDQEQMVVQEVA